jgi:hypothetical protein
MKEHFKNLNLMYAALLIGQVLFFLIILYVVWGSIGSSGVLPIDYNTQLMLAAAGLIAVFFGTRVIGNLFRDQALAKKQDAHEKLNTYRKSLLLRWVLAEGVNIMILIFALLQQNQTLLLFFAIGILVFLSFKPSPIAFAQAYQLSMLDEQLIR